MSYLESISNYFSDKPTKADPTKADPTKADPTKADPTSSSIGIDFGSLLPSSVEDSVVEPIEDSVVEPIEDSVVEPIEDSVVEPIEGSVVEPMEGFMDDSVVEPMEELTTDTKTEVESWNWGSWSISRYLVIILILAFFGFNLFAYLGNITGNLIKVFGPLARTLGFTIGESIKQVTNVTAVGAETAVKATANTIDGGINILEKGLNSSTLQSDTALDNTSLNTDFTRSESDSKVSAMKGATEALKKAEAKLREAELKHPKPDEADSSTQRSYNVKKSGYCYIGEDRGFRSCMKVGAGDNCMSGEIFPTKDICVNPSLRQ